MQLYFNLHLLSEFSDYLSLFVSLNIGKYSLIFIKIFLLKYWFLLFILLIVIVYISTFAFKIKNKFLFANEIVNKGNILTIATNKKGELSFCSDQITELLGYTKEEVMGFGFWNLTEDEEFIGEDYHEDYIDNKFHIRKLKCKNGDYKFIQWKDRKFSEDLIIGIGQDVTAQMNIQTQFENLIENANDVIFETDNLGNYTFINKHSEVVTGYKLEEFKGKHFTDLIRPDFKQKVSEFYTNPSDDINELPTLIFPILNKTGKSIWLSQNVTIKRNSNRKVQGFTVIARDITLIKELEIERLQKQKKIKTYNDTLKDITLKNSFTSSDFNYYLTDLLKILSKKIDVNRVGYWTYTPKYIECNSLYVANLDTYRNGSKLLKKDFPIYFNALENEVQIVASDVFKSEITKEFCVNYFPENKIKSLLDTPIYLNGNLTGVLCLETTTKIKQWDNEDINFVRSIADYIALAIETNNRIKTEKKLAYKSELLTATTNITNLLLKTKNIDSICNEILSIIGNATKVDRVHFFINNEETKSVKLTYEWVLENANSQILNKDLMNFPNENFIELLSILYENKEYSFIVSELEESLAKKSLQDRKIISLLRLPIFVKNTFYGFIGFDDCKKERIWSDDEINILRTLANNLSSALERNINESILLESEERFKLLATNIPGTVHLSNYDEKWSKNYLNDEIEKITGYEKTLFLENKIFYVDLIHPEDRHIILESEKTLRVQKQKFHLIYRIIHKNGNPVWIEEFGEPIIKNNEIDYVVGIFIDITKRVEVENAIKDKNYAEAANKAKSEFLANMSHEIRTPLNGIIGFTDLLKHTKLESIQKNYMNTINESAHSLMGIINDILDFSKIESGKLDLDIRKYDLKNLVNQVIELVKYDANNKKLDLILDINPNVPKYVWADIVRIKQILINLLGNAVKFTENGFVKLTITNINSISDDENEICFSVKDNGIGIKKDFQEKIFDAFSQGDNSTTRRFGGTGLGLSISNQLLSLMNSRLHLESELGKGSNFYFNIILKTSDENTLEVPENIDFVVKERETINYGQENFKILIIEDNKINMLLAKTLVKQILPNVTIFEAVNGKEGVEKFKVLFPDLILMDIQMPVMNGYEATLEIRKIKKGNHTPIIALTAGTVIGEKEKCIEAGMNDYASKPIVKEILEEIISKWIKN